MKKGIISFVSILTGGVITSIIMKKFNNNTIENKNKKVNKFKLYYALLNEWLYIKQDNRNLAEYFNSNGYKHVGIYGLGEMGDRLISELKETEIEVVYGIDKDIEHVTCDISAYSLDDIDKISKEADVVVVTAVFIYDEIKDMLYRELKTKIVSLEEIVFGMRN